MNTSNLSDIPPVPLSNTQFHKEIDALMQNQPEEKTQKILDVIHQYIQYISQEDAKNYLPKIKVELINNGVENNSEVINEIDGLVTSLMKGSTLPNMPSDIIMLLSRGLNIEDHLHFITETNTSFLTAEQALVLLQKRPQEEQVALDKKEAEFNKKTLPDLQKRNPKDYPAIRLAYQQKDRELKEMKQAFLQQKLELAKIAGPLLKTLDLSNINTEELESQIFEELTINCPNLQNIKFSHNQEWKIPFDAWMIYATKIAKTNLIEVQFSSDKKDITDQQLEELIAACPNIKEITFFGCPNITGEGIKCLERLTSLTFLFLKNVPQIKDKDLDFLQHLTQLTSLYLIQMQIKDKDLDFLQHLTQLTSLNLCDMKIEGSCLEYLQKLPNLKELGLSGSKIKDENLNFLEECHSLEKLYLSSCSTLTERCFLYLINLKSLNNLHVDGEEHYTCLFPRYDFSNFTISFKKKWDHDIEIMTERT